MKKPKQDHFANAMGKMNKTINGRERTAFNELHSALWLEIDDAYSESRGHGLLKDPGLLNAKIERIFEHLIHAKELINKIPWLSK